MSAKAAANAQLASTVGESILYGVNLTVSAAALYLLAAKREKNRTTNILIAATFIMFALATAHYGMVTRMTWAIFGDDIPLNKIREGPTEIASYCFEGINVFIGDGIVIWRVWILWYRRWMTILVPIILWSATLGVGIFATYVVSQPTLAYMASSAFLAWACMVCLTNLCTVGLTACRYWQYHQEVVSVLGKRAHNRNIMVFLLESGALYCATWIALIAITATTSQWSHFMAQLTSQATSLYPTMIIVLVCLKATSQDVINSLPRVSRLSRIELPTDALKSTSLGH